MSKRAFERIKAGLEEAIAIQRGEADPATYRVHVSRISGPNADFSSPEPSLPKSATYSPKKS